MDTTLLAILGGIVALILALKFLLEYSVKKERQKDPPTEKKSPPKEECKRLVHSALEAGEPLVATKKPLMMDEDCQEIWAALPEELTSFLSQHGKISWESGGYVGGHIYRVSRDKALSRFLRELNHDITGLVIGTDEAEMLYVIPGQDKIFCASNFLNRVDCFDHVFELLVSYAGLE